MSTKSDLQQAVEGHVGKTIAGVVMLQNWNGTRDVGFRLEFTDGTSMEVSSDGSCTWEEGTWVTVNAS